MSAEEVPEVREPTLKVRQIQRREVHGPCVRDKSTDEDKNEFCRVVSQEADLVVLMSPVTKEQVPSTSVPVAKKQRT